MIRLGKGDYLLPSQDAKTLWRIATYEDGPSHGIMDWPRDLILWGLWKWNGEMPTVDQIAANLEEGVWTDRWLFWEGGHRTRSEAIESVVARG
jgi:hypothetical protein